MRRLTIGLVAATGLALGAAVAGAQTETQGLGLETGAVGEQAFVGERQEYHVLASDLIGREVQTSVAPDAQGLQQTGPDDAALAGGAMQPVGRISDVLMDRTGAVAGLVVELDAGPAGDAREVAVVIAVVEFVADLDDPATTQVRLAVNSADLQNAPAFVR